MRVIYKNCKALKWKEYAILSNVLMFSDKTNHLIPTKIKEFIKSTDLWAVFLPKWCHFLDSDVIKELAFNHLREIAKKTTNQITNYSQLLISAKIISFFFLIIFMVWFKPYIFILYNSTVFIFPRSKTFIQCKTNKQKKFNITTNHILLNHRLKYYLM